MPDGYAIWSADGRPVSVHLRASVGGSIQAFNNAEPETGPATECGGVLWGRVRDTGENYYIVSIEHVELFECKHDRGEGFALSERDHTKLRKHLKQKHGDLKPVGFWRTHRRPGLYLDRRDFELMSAFFAQPWCVALCVLPSGRAGFFLWEDGDIRRTSSYREFQLPDAVQPANASLPDSAPRWRTWAAAAACAAILAVMPLLLKSTSASGTPFNVLSMRAETKPGTLRLSWNPRSRALAQGQGAILWIADGAEESKLELTSEQVRAGILEYRPSGEDVNFRMQIGDFTESLRVHGAIPAQTPVQQAAIVERQPEATITQPPPRVSDSEAKRSRRSRSVADASRMKSTPSPIQPPLSEEGREQDEVPPPPQIAAAPARLEDRPPLPHRGLDVAPVFATVEKPHSSPLKKAFGWMVAGRKKDFVPAKPVQRFQPHARAEQPTTVAVRISIDQQGIVRDADLLTKDVDNHLGRSAIEAAKRWKFEPARVDDRPVSSDLVVRFRFGSTDPK